MKHLHHQSIDSTSLFLKDHFKDLIKKDRELLVSAEKQTKGRGRSDHTWEQPDNSLAFSFNILPCEELTLTSLEIGILLSRYLKDKLFLKWPNDILNSDFHKCGGILCQLIDKDNLIVGIGINYGKFDSKKYQFAYPIGSVHPEKILSSEDYKNIPLDIYQYILANRMRPDDIIKDWKKNCFHTRKCVRIIDGETSHEGLFEGIDKDGAALLTVDGKLKKVMCGSLFVIQ